MDEYYLSSSITIVCDRNPTLTVTWHRLALWAVLMQLPAGAAAQSAGRSGLVGTWEVELGGEAFVVTIRGDSSASLGDQTVRYRLKADSLLVALGEEWLAYVYHIRGRQLTISGGDLIDPITLRYVGPATSRPDSLPLPPAPPDPSPRGP
jgi:hypothetical protein